MRCELCHADVLSSDPAPGLTLCARCGSGDLAAAEARLGITVDVRQVQIVSGASRGWSLVVELTLPGPSEVLGKVAQARETFGGVFRRLFHRGGRKGLDLAHATFDDAVVLEPEEGAAQAMHDLFADAGNRRLALELICMGCDLEFYSRSVWATARCSCHPPVLPDAAEVSTRLVALSLG